MLDSLQSFIEKGNKAIEEKNYLIALTAYQDALRLSPDDPKLMAKVGFAAYKMKNLPLAIEMYAKALEKDPRDTGIMGSLGRLYIKTGDKTKALSVCEKLRKVNPEKGEELYKDIYK